MCAYGLSTYVYVYSDLILQEYRFLNLTQACHISIIINMHCGVLKNVCMYVYTSTHLAKLQTMIELPWQVVDLKVKPPVSCRTLTTSVGYMKGLRHTWRPVASGRQDSSTLPSRLLTILVDGFTVQPRPLTT